MSISHGSGRHRIELLIGDHVLPYTMTVYEAVKQFSRTHEHEGTDTDTDSEMLFGSASIWINTHTIWFLICCYVNLHHMVLHHLHSYIEKICKLSRVPVIIYLKLGSHVDRLPTLNVDCLLA